MRFSPKTDVNTLQTWCISKKVWFLLELNLFYRIYKNDLSCTFVSAVNTCCFFGQWNATILSRNTIRDVEFSPDGTVFGEIVLEFPECFSRQFLKNSQHRFCVSWWFPFYIGMRLKGKKNARINTHNLIGLPSSAHNRLLIATIYRCNDVNSVFFIFILIFLSLWEKIKMKIFKKKKSRRRPCTANIVWKLYCRTGIMIWRSIK